MFCKFDLWTFTLNQNSESPSFLNMINKIKLTVNYCWCIFHVICLTVREWGGHCLHLEEWRAQETSAQSARFQVSYLVMLSVKCVSVTCRRSSSFYFSRRLCILKGVHPHEPKHPKKVGRGSTAPKTYYLMKDIAFLMHEPIIHKFRQFKVRDDWYAMNVLFFMMSVSLYLSDLFNRCLWKEWEKRSARNRNRKFRRSQKTNPNIN